MKDKISLLAALLAAVLLPSQAFAQPFPRNTNQSTRLKSGIFKGSGNLIMSNNRFSVIAGGGDNTIREYSWYSFIGGGDTHTLEGENVTISGGGINTAGPGRGATIGGGLYNTASAYVATVPGGFENLASGDGSFAAGQKARATHNGSFVWSVLDATTSSAGPDSFTVRAPGGARFLTTLATGADPLVGVQLVAGATAWSILSDSNAKTSVKAVDPRAVLAKVEDMPVTEWEYKHDPNRKYFGPMAQDFHSAFGLGTDDKTINTLDADGVLFLSVKGLVEEIKLRDEKIAQLEAQSLELGTKSKAEIDALKTKLQKLEQRLDSLPPR